MAMKEDMRTTNRLVIVNYKAIIIGYYELQGCLTWAHHERNSQNVAF